MNPGTLVFRGELQAESPIAINPPDIRKKRGSDQPQTLPVMSVFLDHGYVETVYIPASSIRGALRRCALQVVRDALIAASGERTPLDLETHYFLSIGGVKGREKEDKLNLTKQMERRRRNPLISLFGAGDPWVQGRLCTHSAIPKTPLTLAATPVINGVRSDDFMRSPDRLTFMAPDQVARWLLMREQTSEVAAVKTRSRQLRRAIAQANRNGDASQAQDLAEELKQAEGTIHSSANPVNLPLAGYHAIPKGARMDHSFMLINADLVEIGLFLASLKRFAALPLLGGHRNHGCGLISASWTLFLRHADGIEQQGELRLAPYSELTLDGAGELLRAAEQAWLDRAAKLCVSDFKKSLNGAETD